MVTWTQLLLLACMIAVNASQTCDDITCCSGLVCIEDSPGRSEMNRTKCVKPTSCDQLDCPSGQVCISEPRGFGAPPKVSCQASCDAVQCPSFLQCVEEISGTKCVVPNDCALVECPPGFECQSQQIGKKTFAVCIGSSCDSLDCFDDGECIDFTSHGPLDPLARKPHKSRTNTDKTMTGASGLGSIDIIDLVNASLPAETDFATCLPTCERADICPQGLVCDIDHYKLVCREPVSCEELECPPGQECEEVECEHGRAHGRTKTKSKTNTGTKTYTSTKSKSRGNILLQCVEIQPSGSGMEDLFPTTATTDADSPEPPVLERIGGNDQVALLANSAHSLIATIAAFVLPMCVCSLLFL